MKTETYEKARELTTVANNLRGTLEILKSDGNTDDKIRTISVFYYDARLLKTIDEAKIKAINTIIDEIEQEIKKLDEEFENL